MLPLDQMHDWLSIRLVPDMTRARFYALMGEFATPADVFGASAARIAAVRGFSQELATEVLSSNATDRARRHIDQMQRAEIRLITRACDDYPYGLKHSTLAPPILFVKGTLHEDDKYSVSLVGSRHATTYGRSVARELAGDLARYGLTIVSGFARGIDGEAHYAAIRAGGRTLAILGNGLDICYPSEHHSLGTEIIRNGAMISEYPLGTSPERYNFPERNHVIAALSLGTIVVEAAEKSGSLITSRLALDENRFVFAVPGDITRKNSRGANRLIHNGACMVQRAKDVLIEMKDVLRAYLNVDQLIDETPLLPELDTAPEIERRTTRSRDWVDKLQGVDPSEFDKLLEEVQAAVALSELTTAPAPPPQPAPSNPSATSKAPPAHLAASSSETASSITGVPNYSEDDTQIISPLDTAPPPFKSDDTQPLELQPAPARSLQPEPKNVWDKTKAPPSVTAAAATSIVSRDDMPSAKKLQLTEEERFITELLYHEAMVFDELADRAYNRGLDVPRLTSLLLKLEMRRVIRQLPGRYYVLYT